MKEIIAIFSAYIITAVLVNGNVFYSFREWFKIKTPYLFKGIPPRHLIDCRMCVGFWISLIVAIIVNDLSIFLLIYGVSYFLATQER